MNYKNGELEGKFIEYSSGKPSKEGTYKNGKLDGEWKEYDDDGKVVVIEHYKLGKKEGKHWRTSLWDRRSGIKMTSTEYYKDDAPAGKWEKKLDTGRLIETRDYKGDGTSVRNSYHENGKLYETKHYKGDKYHGDFKRYDDLGILTKEGSYENDYINYEKEYYPNGQLKFEKHFSNREPDGKYLAYNERGKLLTSGEYDKGYEKGLWKYYSFKGVLEKEVNFKEGRKEGAYKEYYPSGTSRN